MAVRNIAPFGVRIPDALKDRIREQAEKNRRSVNAEILVMLERDLSQPIETKKADATA